MLENQFMTYAKGRDISKFIRTLLVMNQYLLTQIMLFDILLRILYQNYKTLLPGCYHLIKSFYQ
jgi:hypothetical protein